METDTLEKKIENIQFPVNLQELYFGNHETKKKKVSGYKCLINSETNRLISIVSNGYKVITHKEAINFGLRCMHELTGVAIDEITIFRAASTLSGSAVCIDLLHKAFEINLLQKEVYIPYLRVTNSYNKTRALRFDLGFVRELCSNGVIFERETIQFNFSHTKKILSETIEFNIPAGKFDALKSKFENYLVKIKEIKLKDTEMFPVFLKAINYNIESIKNSTKTLEKFEKLQVDAKILFSKYKNQFGESIYTVFNAATDFASSRKNKDNSESILINGLQRNCGNWLSEFCDLKTKPDFNLQQYLGTYADYALN